MGANKNSVDVEIDGRTGEGGGQLVRIACALAAATSQSLRVHHIRGRRGNGTRGGGLKSQHLTAIRYLAEATGADVEGLEIGSPTLTFRPRRRPSELFSSINEDNNNNNGGNPKSRVITIAADSAAASAMLILQAVLPFLLLAGGEDTIDLRILGGTNVSFSPSYEYLDQVLLPALRDRFGLAAHPSLEARGWSQGPTAGSRGAVRLRFRPLPPGRALEPQLRPRKPTTTTKAPAPAVIGRVDASVVAHPPALRDALQRALAADAEALFPRAEVRFPVVEDSGHEARLYVLLVAHEAEDAEGGGQHRRRWGRDYLKGSAGRGDGGGGKSRLGPRGHQGEGNRKKKKGKSAEETAPETIARDISWDLCEGLQRDEVLAAGDGDGHLLDQLVVFQAVARGTTSFRHEARQEEAGEELAGRMGAVGLGEEGGQRIVSDLDLGAGPETVVRPEVRMRRDKDTLEPFGEGSLHARTARWVASEMLPAAKWYNDGTICEGAGVVGI